MNGQIWHTMQAGQSLNVRRTGKKLKTCRVKIYARIQKFYTEARTNARLAEFLWPTLAIPQSNVIIAHPHTAVIIKSQDMQRQEQKKQRQELKNRAHGRGYRNPRQL